MLTLVLEESLGGCWQPVTSLLGVIPVGMLGVTCLQSQLTQVPANRLKSGRLDSAQSWEVSEVVDLNLSDCGILQEQDGSYGSFPHKMTVFTFTANMAHKLQDSS